MNTPGPTIFVVDDDPAVLKAVSRLLRAAGFTVRTFSSPGRFLNDPHLDTHGCVILDLAMPEANGLDLQQTLADRGVCLPIIFLTGRGDISKSVRAMKQGAIDFLTKPVDQQDLIEAVTAAVSKDRAARTARTEIDEIRARLATLTPREYEVLEHVVSGKLNKQTASELGTAEKTIKVHRARVMEKMRVASLAELVHLADRAGVPVPGPHD